MVGTRIYDPPQHEQEVGLSTTKLQMVGRIAGIRHKGYREAVDSL